VPQPLRSGVPKIGVCTMDGIRIGRDVTGKTATSRRLGRAVIAGAATLCVAILVTNGLAVSAEKSIQVASISAADPTIVALKAKYHRPLTIPFPKDNPYTPAKAVLGKTLYFDTRLSGANALACASCHDPAYDWGDGRPKGIGTGMKPLGRRSPSIVNAAYGEIFMWDGRMASLEEQALGPIKTDVEMNLPLDQLVDRIKGTPEYGPLFQAAFPHEGITPETIAKAIATYERTVVSGRAPFDAWIEGNEKAISDSAKNGFVLFNTKAHCSACHSGWNFTDDSFHDIGLPDQDIGRGKFLPDVVKMQHAFKTPGLREIARRAPYVHDGSIPTLAAVVEHYAQGGVDRPSRADEVKPLQLTDQEKKDLVNFMTTLTSDMEPTTIPKMPR
jgi:cytochrome c peroxidase